MNTKYISFGKKPAATSFTNDVVETFDLKPFDETKLSENPTSENIATHEKIFNQIVEPTSNDKDDNENRRGIVSDEKNMSTSLRNPEPSQILGLLNRKMPSAKPVLQRNIDEDHLEPSASSSPQVEQQDKVEAPIQKQKPKGSRISEMMLKRLNVKQPKKPVIDSEETALSFPIEEPIVEEKIPLQLLFECEVMKGIQNDDVNTFNAYVQSLQMVYKESELQFVLDNASYIKYCVNTNAFKMFGVLYDLGFLDITKENLYNTDVQHCCEYGSLEVMIELLKRGDENKLDRPDLRYMAKVSTYFNHTNVLSWIHENVEEAKELRYWIPLIESAKKYDNNTIDWYMKTFPEQFQN
jgi:hypothetical protein